MRDYRITPKECWQISLEEREESHRRLLLAQLQKATRKVPFYRSLRLPLEDFHKSSLREILQALPIVTKEMIRGRNPDFLSSPLPPGHWLKTGGSTGEPTEVYHDREQLRWGKESVEFARNWWGVKTGQKCFYIWGHSASLASGWPGRKDRLLRPAKDFLRRRLRINAYRVDQDSLKDNVRRLIKFQPQMIIGYTSTIFLIAEQFLAEGHNPALLPKLGGVIVTADPCYPFQAELIQKAFGSPVIMEYGSVEVGAIAYSHPDGTFRVLEDRLLVETPSDSSEFPEIVVTDLSSQGQPLIRFSIEDQCQSPITPPTDEQGYRLLGPIIGRVLDSISGKDGKRLHGVALSHIVNVSYPQVLRYQFFQDKYGKLKISLQLKGSTPTDSNSEGRLLSYLTNELGPIPIEIFYVENFPPTPSGKFRWVLSEMTQN